MLYVSSYGYICVLILCCYKRKGVLLKACASVSSYMHTDVYIYVCPHVAIYIRVLQQLLWGHIYIYQYAYMRIIYVSFLRQLQAGFLFLGDCWYILMCASYSSFLFSGYWYICVCVLIFSFFLGPTRKKHARLCICVLILLYCCICVLVRLYVSAYTTGRLNLTHIRLCYICILLYICVLILYMCPHTLLGDFTRILLCYAYIAEVVVWIYSRGYICVLIHYWATWLNAYTPLLCMHTTIYVSSYCCMCMLLYVCVLILLYVYTSLYKCVLTLLCKRPQYEDAYIAV